MRESRVWYDRKKTIGLREDCAGRMRHWTPRYVDVYSDERPFAFMYRYDADRVAFHQELELVNVDNALFRCPRCGTESQNRLQAALLRVYSPAVLFEPLATEERFWQ